MSDDSLKLSKQFCHKLYIATNAVVRAYRPLLDELDLTYPQYLTMLALWEQDMQEINQILDKTLIDPGAFSLILKKLQSKGLVEVTPSAHDRRVKTVSLSEAGLALKDKAQDIPKQMICKTPSLSEDDANTLSRIALSILDDLSER